MNIVKPATEKQALFINSESDITIFNGAAIGKTYASYMIHLKGINEPLYRGAITKGSGRALSFTFEEASEFYKPFNPIIFNNKRQLVFESGARISFHTIGRTIKDIPWAYGAEFDVVTVDDASSYLSMETFWYIVSRIRGRSLVHKGIYIGCSVSEDSDIKHLVKPWLDSDGYPDTNKNGKEYFVARDQEFEVIFSSHDHTLNYPLTIKYIHDKATSLQAYLPDGYVDRLLSLGEGTQSLYYCKW